MVVLAVVIVITAARVVNKTETTSSTLTKSYDGSSPNNYDRKIFFVELFSKFWHPFTLCSVYSTAIQNPTAEVIVYSKNPHLPELWKNAKNLRMLPLDVEEMLSVEKSILDWYMSG